MTSRLTNTHLDIGERIRLVRENQSRDEFSATVGVSRNTLMRYERGERRPDADFLRRVCEHYPVDPAWLLLGQAEADHPIPAVEDPFSEDFALVPLYSVEVSAGHGAAIDQERPAARLAFRRDWLKEIGLQENKIATVTASGDSMEPTIHDGDVLLLDTTQRQVIKDAIYVVRQDRLLYVKRLQRLYDGSIRIGSDNPAYTHEIVPKRDLPFLEIIGRVVWSGGTL